MKAGNPPAPRTGESPPAHRAHNWKFALEIFPPDWRCPASEFWIAGWIMSRTGAGAADVRAWIGANLYLGLCGLPRADAEQANLGHLGPPFAGFSFLLRAASEARELRLEACDENGCWREFFRQEIFPHADAVRAQIQRGVSDASGIVRSVLRLLAARRAQPSASWPELADAVLSSAAAIPLDALPNPPLYGRLELPLASATVKFGLIEISGWLAHRELRIKRLLAFVEPAKPVVLLRGLPRRDVVDVFGELKDGPRSQFLGYIEVPRYLPRPLNLRLIAELENGEQPLAFNRRLDPDEPESATSLPPYSALTFGRAAAAYWQASQRRRWSVGDRVAFRENLRAAAEEFRAAAPWEINGPLPIPTPLPPARARALKIVVVTHNLNREGAPLIALEYASHLARQPGWEVRVVSPEDGPLRTLFSHAGINVAILDLKSVGTARSPSDLAAAIDFFADHCGWQDADLIVANTMVSFWAMAVARRLGKPSILYVHESAPVRRFFRALVSPALFPAIEQVFGDATTVVFAAAASQAAHGRHERRRNFRVLPGWVDAQGIAAYAAAHTRSDLRRAKNIEENAIVFINVGSVSERKGQVIFVRAIEILQRRRLAPTPSGPALIFLMVGATPGPFVDFLRHDISLRQLAHVHLVEAVSDPNAYFRLADIFVCSSFEESLPRVVMEAAAFGLPIVSTAVNGIPEILSPDEAWLVSPGDAAQLAEAMELALAAHATADRTKAQRAREHVRTAFDSSVLLPQHARLAAAMAEVRAG